MWTNKSSSANIHIKSSMDAAVAQGKRATTSSKPCSKPRCSKCGRSCDTLNLCDQRRALTQSNKHATANVEKNCILQYLLLFGSEPFHCLRRRFLASWCFSISGLGRQLVLRPKAGSRRMLQNKTICQKLVVMVEKGLMVRHTGGAHIKLANSTGLKNLPDACLQTTCHTE